MKSSRPVFTAVAFLLLQISRAASPPQPSFADISYGSHPHQVLDIYLPDGTKEPSPVLIWFGGIWKPAKHAPNLDYFSSHHIAVVAVETRTMNDATADQIKEPVSYVMEDACRAVQFIRTHAAKWNLDPARIAVGGGSQGTLPALYVGCSPDHARADASDPVERASTRVVCVAAFRSQPSIDPQRMQQWVPGVKWGAPALGCSFEESLKKRDELLPVIKKWSPDWLLHHGAAPIYFENEWGLTKPDNIEETNYKVHSPAWGLGFKKLAEQAGVICYNKFPGHPTDGYADTWDFIAKELTKTAE